MNQSISHNSEFAARDTMPAKNIPVTNRRGRGVTGVRSALKAVASKSSGAYSPSQLNKLTDRFRRPPAIATYLIILLLVITTCFLGYRNYQSDQQNRRSDGEQNARMAQLEERISQTDKQITTLSQSNRELLSRLSMPAKLWGDYRGGVCLIYGSYIFIDKDTGLPVVETLDSSAIVGYTQTVKEAAGKAAEVSFEATGFHAGDGYILTNRHTVEPWKFNFWPAYFGILRNARPRLTKLLAFFPDRSQPYALEVNLISPHDDIAICKLGAAVDAKEIPSLPLDSGHRGDEIGEEVTMLAYPNGTDRLLAVIQVAERQRLLKRFGESSPALIRHFAQRKMIKPLMSRGQVMDLYDNRIVFGGTNAEGSSGGPVFGPSGRVIGINFGYFMQNESMNYAVPIDRAISLLSKAGWKHME